MLLHWTDTGGNAIMKPIVSTVSPFSIMWGFINIICPHYYCSWSCMTFHSMYSVVQCMRCWIWYETRQFGIWGRPLWASSSNAADLDYVTVKHKARVSQREVCICECVRKKRVMALSLWQYCALLASHMSKSQMEQHVFFHLAALKVT